MHATQNTFLNGAKIVIDFSYKSDNKNFIFFQYDSHSLRSIRISLIPWLFRRALAFDFTDPLASRWPVLAIIRVTR